MIQADKSLSMSPLLLTGTLMLLSGASVTAEDLQFTNVTEEAGIDFFLDAPVDSWFRNAHFFGGVGIGDFDDNGALDIYFSGGGGSTDRLYLNDGTGTFTDASTEWGLTSVDFSCGVGVCDIDNDGRLDVVVASGGPAAIQFGATGGYRLYRNIDGTHFEDIAESAGVHNVSPGTRQHPTFATPGDFNADGWVDLLYGSWDYFAQGNRFYLNNGDMTFTDVTESMGFEPDVRLSKGFSASVTDMDGDLHPDILWVGDFNKSKYWRNNGDGTFENIRPTNGTGDDRTAMGGSIFDFNLDGKLDWFVGAIRYPESDAPYNGNCLFMQLDDHQFTNLGLPMGVNDSGWSWASSANDFDQDGLEDLIVGNGTSVGNGGFFRDTPETVFKQESLNGTFFNVTVESGIDVACQATSLAAFDMDMDGDLDVLFVCNEGMATLYRNDTPNAGSWLQIKLGGDPANRIPNFGFNTRVEARIGDTTRVRYMDGKPSYGSCGPQALHFGFGDATVVDELTVRWINGDVTVMTDVPVNQVLEINPPSLTIPGDINGDTWVDGSDLAQLLASWGECPDDPEECPEDLDGDGVVGGADIATLLSLWNQAP